MGIIVPAILPESRLDLEEKLAQLRGICDDVQIDIVDGKFASPASWPYREDPAEPQKMLAAGELFFGNGDHKIEIDLMSQDPETAAGSFVALGATRLTIHAESTRYIPRFIESTRALYGHDKDFVSDLLSLGLALGVESDLALIEPHLSQIEYVQFMGIRTIGHQGEAFDTRVLQKIATFRKRYPDMPVQIDGGVTLQTAPALLEAGVSRLIVGSALWKSEDVRQTYHAFTALSEKHGIYE